MEIKGRKKVCAYCSSKRRTAPSEKDKQTTQTYKKSDLPLCRVGCFLQYQQQTEVKYKTEKSRKPKL
jgi:hypothetical protein